MTKYHFPLEFVFKIGTLANDFTATDVHGQPIAYVRQKMFKLKEEVVVYNNDSKSEAKYKIKANKWLDFSSVYAFSNFQNEQMGSIARKGLVSLWKARYEIYDANKQQLFAIQEDNGWIKLIDFFIGGIPVLNFFTGYLFNPSYSLKTMDQTPLVRLKKDSSFFGRRFKISKLSEIDEKHEDVIMLGLMMMILLERRRG